MDYCTAVKIILETTYHTSYDTNKLKGKIIRDKYAFCENIYLFVYKKTSSSYIQNKWEGEENLWVLLFFTYLYFPSFP